MRNAERTPARLSYKRKRYRLLQSVLDLLALAAAWHLSIELRLLLNPVMQVQLKRTELWLAAPPLSAMLFLWILVALWLRVYQLGKGPLGTAELVRVLESGIIAGTLAIVATFFFRQFGEALSRSFVLLFVPASLLTLSAARYATSRAAIILETKWPARERIAMLGQGREVRLLIDRIRSVWEAAFLVVGVIVPAGAASRGLGTPVPVLGTTKELAEVINRERLHRILIVDGSLAKREIDQCARISKRMGVIVSRAICDAEPDTRLELSPVLGLQLVELKPVYFTRKQELIKRALDVIGSAALLVILAPVLGVFALLVKLTSQGPVLYRSPRVGRGGRHFSFLKFRSMYSCSENRGDLIKRNEKTGHLFKIRNDSRVTPLGRFMRRYSIDELPQLINVLRGEMSLAGPRPLPAQDLDPDGQSKVFKVWAEHRSRVLPGITGLWQISGRSDLSFEKMTELDLQYIRNWSLALDLRILLKTPLVVLTGQGAY